MNRLRAFLRSIGRKVVQDEEVFAPGGTLRAFEVEVSDNLESLRILNQWAQAEAKNPEIIAMGERFRASPLRILDDSRGGPLRAIATEIHAFVKEAVRFQEEHPETFRSPKLTLSLGAGDCDDHALLFSALCLSAGVRSVIVGLRGKPTGPISHAVSRVYIGDGTWAWAETTIDAAFGEHPHEAAKRLGILRKDILDHEA
jgi:hypothetical protein